MSLFSFSPSPGFRGGRGGKEKKKKTGIPRLLQIGLRFPDVRFHKEFLLWVYKSQKPAFFKLRQCKAAIYPARENGWDVKNQSAAQQRNSTLGKKKAKRHQKYFFTQQVVQRGRVF